MSFQFTEEQVGLADSVRKFFSDRVSSAMLHTFRDRPAWDDALTNELCELGIFSLFSMGDESYKPGAIELGIIAAESGRGLFPLPLGELVACGPYLVSTLPADDQSVSKKAREEIFSGSRRVVFACTAESGLVIPTTVTQADVLVLEQGGVYRIPYESVVRGSTIPTVDLLQPMQTFTVAPQAKQLLAITEDRVRTMLFVCRSNECAGLAARAVSMTTEHVTTRKQFGSPIGSFQAVQHRLAEMHLLAESMASLARFAAWAVDHSPAQAPFAARSAMVFAATHVAEILEGAVQLHGGIGFTWEYDLHLFLRRAKYIEMVYAPSPQERTILIERAMS